MLLILLTHFPLHRFKIFIIFSLPLHTDFPLHRFSEEINTGKECSQTIDWSELAKAAERAQNELAGKEHLNIKFSVQSGISFKVVRNSFHFLETSSQILF